MPTFFIPKPSKIYPNLDFCFENIPSGKPGSGDHWLLQKGGIEISAIIDNH
jgi:hypothetical protein